MSTDLEENKTYFEEVETHEEETAEVLATQTHAFELLGDQKSNIITSYAHRKLASIIQIMDAAGTVTPDEFFTQITVDDFLKRLPLTRDRFSMLLRSYLDYYVPGEAYPSNFLSIDSFTTFLEIKLGDMMYLDKVIKQLKTGLNDTFKPQEDTSNLISKYNNWVEKRREKFPQSKFKPETIEEEEVTRIIEEMRDYGLITFGLSEATIDNFQAGVSDSKEMLYASVSHLKNIYEGIVNPDPDLQIDLVDIFLNIAPTYAFQAINDISTYLFRGITSNSPILSALRHEMKLINFLSVISTTEHILSKRDRLPPAKVKERLEVLHNSMVRTGEFLQSSTLYKNRSALLPYNSIPLYEIIQTTSYLETGNMQALTEGDSLIVDMFEPLLHPENALRIAVIFNELENNAWKAIVDRKYVESSWSPPSNAIVKNINIELDSNGIGPVLVLRVFDKGIGLNSDGKSSWRDPLQLSSGTGLGLLAELDAEHSLEDIRNNSEEYAHYINQGYRTLSTARIPMLWKSPQVILEA